MDDVIWLATDYGSFKLPPEIVTLVSTGRPANAEIAEFIETKRVEFESARSA